MFSEKETSDLSKVEQTITAREEEKASLKRRLIVIEDELKSLRHTWQILTGAPTADPTLSKSIPDLIEEVLKNYGALHVNEILKHLGDYNVRPSRQTVSGALIRYVKAGRRFRRVGPNQFDVKE